MALRISPVPLVFVALLAMVSCAQTYLAPFPGVYEVSLEASNGTLVAHLWVVNNGTAPRSGSFGISTNGRMTGPVVSCYVPSDASPPTCVNGVVSPGMFTRTTLLSTVTNVSSNMNSWNLTVITPWTALGVSEGSSVTMMFCHAYWNNATGNPTRHAPTSRTTMAVQLPQSNSSNNVTAVTTTTVAPQTAATTTTTVAPQSPVPQVTSSPTTTSPTSNSSSDSYSTTLSVCDDLLQCSITFDSSVVVVTLNYSGDVGVSIGFSTSGMQGPMISCYQGKCYDVNAVSFNVNPSTDSVTRVIAASADANGSSVTFATPKSRLSQLSPLSRIIFARTAGFNTAQRIPNPHDGSTATHVALTVNFETGAAEAEGDPPFTQRSKAYIAVAATGVGIIAILAVVMHIAYVYLSPKMIIAVKLLTVALLIGMVALVTVLAYQDFCDGGEEQPQYRAFGESTAFLFSVLLIPTSKQVGLGRLIGSSYERLIWLHPIIAFLLVITMTTHMGGMFQMFDNKSELFDDTGNIFGFICWLVTIIFLFIPSVFVRQKSYKFFRFTHAMFIVVLIFGALHYDPLWLMMIPGFVLWVVDVGIRCWHAKYAYYIIRSFHDQLSGVVELDVRVPWTEAPPAGSYSFVLAPSVDLLMHPFSVALYEPHPEGGGKASFFVKVNLPGSWTARLGEVVDKNNGNPIALKLLGFHGSLQIPLSACKHAVLVAGGIGVTAIMSILQSIAHGRDNSAVERVTLIWVVRNWELYIFLKDKIHSIAVKAISSGRPVDLKLFFTGSRTGAANLSAITASASKALEPKIDDEVEMTGLMETLLGGGSVEVNAIVAEELLGGGFPLDVGLQPPPRRGRAATVVSKKVDASDMFVVEFGRPNFGVLINEIVQKSTGPSSDFGVFVCGPSVMMKTVQDAAVAKSLRLHQEVFEF